MTFFSDAQNQGDDRLCSATERAGVGRDGGAVHRAGARRQRAPLHAAGSGLVWQLAAAAGETPDDAHIRQALASALMKRGDAVRQGFAGKADIRIGIEPAVTRGIGYDDRVLIVRRLSSDAEAGSDDGEAIGMIASSGFITKAALDAGIAMPVTSLGLGIDDWDALTAADDPAIEARGFRFLCMLDHTDAVRLDTLVESFSYVFDDTDDVSLVIAAPEQRLDRVRAAVAAQLEPVGAAPHVVVLSNTLEPARLKALYGQCDVLVSPHRACGFNLTIARALIAGLPVMATAWGGHRSYCDTNNGWEIDFDFEKPAAAAGEAACVFASPRAASLDSLLREVSRLKKPELAARAQAGSRRLLSIFTWDKIAGRLADFVEQCLTVDRLPRTPNRFGWVTTWNTKCGIADHAAQMAKAFSTQDQLVFATTETPVRPDPSSCQRLWTVGKGDNHLEAVQKAVDAGNVRTLIIQFNYGFFDHAQLARLIEDCTTRGVIVLIELHSTVNPMNGAPNFNLAELSGALRKCHRIVVHAQGDLERLKAIGLCDNVMLLPMGVINHAQPRAPIAGRVPILSTFGFCLPGKGLPEIVEAAGLLKEQGRQVRLRMFNAEHPDPISRIEIQKIRRAIARNKLGSEVELVTGYQEAADSIRRLSETDLIVNPYQATGESASASVRTALSAGVPIAVTPLPIFDDLGDVVFRLPGTSPDSMATGLRRILDDIDARTDVALEVERAARAWILAHDYNTVGLRFEKTAQALVSQPFMAA